jgi:hypothetical protein
MIYFVQAVGGGRIKIGTTVQLAKRLQVLACEYKQELRVLAVIDGGREQEQWLHQQFSHLRVVNEFFEPGDDLLGFILDVGKPWEDADKPKQGRGRPKGSRLPLKSIVNFKGTPEYSESLEAFAADLGISQAELLALAVERLAKQKKRPPLPNRLGEQ